MYFEQIEQILMYNSHFENITGRGSLLLSNSELDSQTLDNFVLIVDSYFKSIENTVGDGSVLSTGFNYLGSIHLNNSRFENCSAQNSGGVMFVYDFPNHD